MQFEKGYLNVTIINADRDYIISEITIYLEYGKGAVILLHELVHEPISLGTQSICVDFNWPSGYAYKLLLKKSDGNFIPFSNRSIERSAQRLKIYC